MIARAMVVAEADSDGVTRLSHLRSDGPLILRSTPGALFIVGGAAGPLGGDDLHLRIEVRAGAHLTVRSAAASIALPGSPGAESRLVLEADVGPEASLNWLPEPLIAAAGCRHRTETLVRVGRNAELLWREEVIMGRHNEAGGCLTSRIDFCTNSMPLLRNELVTGPASPGWDGPAVMGGMKALGSILLTRRLFNVEMPAARKVGQTTALLPLAGPAVFVSALGQDAISLRKDLDRALALLDVRCPRGV